MGSKKTPLLQKLRNIGGTLYVFPSATEDIGLNLQSTTSGVAMSHFALLNIPKLSIGNCTGMCSYDIEAQNGNEALAMSLQNYAMNFETHLTNEDTYNYQKLETVSEKVFWHWALHIGILSTNDLKNTTTGNENIFTEHENDQQNSVIKCFGSIDAGNQLSTEFGMFNETYINIPTSWGAGPVFLKRSDSENYKLGSAHTIADIAHLENRGDSNEYYSYTRSQDYPFFDRKSEIYNPRGVYDTYQIQTDNDGFEILKDLNQIQTSLRKRFNNDEILVDSYDDINIDALSQLSVSEQFEFNTILLYYSVYDQDDIIKTAYATNLFGVIFLDGTRPYNNSNDEFYIPTILKRKSTTSQFGNSYSFRVNLKTMSVYDNTDAIIQDNTTLSSVSAVEFSDVVSNLNRAIDIMNSNLTTTLAIQDQYAAIMNYYDNFEDDLRDLSTCLNAYLKGTRSSFVDTSILYTNEIRTSKAESTFGNNTIYVRTHQDTLGQNGEVIYNEPIMTIDDSGVTIANLINSSILSKSSYVIYDHGDSDALIYDDEAERNNNYVVDCEDFMETFTDNVNIKLKIYSDSISGSGDQYTNNELYIAPDSSIFINSGYNLKYLIDSSDNINYVGLIPYIIAELKRLNRRINENNLIMNF